ncbi:DUF192 domain-containing protein [Robertkochia flava]|uniref:DUF192 domain-containing protein n=1 Tax=Robertkochia flava TaxID=3447986 RepID=UPI001CCCA4F9|nr:DUF192 domain-containing protein [Robertkochia marina]
MLRRSLLLLFLALTACKEEKSRAISETPVTFTREATAQIYKGDSLLVDQLEIEIAETPYERQTGLMYRESMKQDQGMWFIFEEEAPRAFYMKNTLIALDILYADKHGRIVSIVKNATPFDKASLPSKYPAKYVLELNAGTADLWNISIQDSIAVKRMDDGK